MFVYTADMGEDQFNQMCSEIDADGDGDISYNEFRKYFMAGEDASGAAMFLAD